MPYDSGLARLTRDECLALLGCASLARVGVSVDALPAILPVTIALMDGAVIFRTIPGTKLALATAGSILAIEADDYDPTARVGWSVLIRGVASELVATREIEHARRLLTDSWITKAHAEHFVRVSCDLVTGRQLQRTAPPGGTTA